MKIFKSFLLIITPILSIAQSHYGWIQKDAIGLFDNITDVRMNSQGEFYGIESAVQLKSFNLDDISSSDITANNFPASVHDFYINPTDVSNSMYISTGSPSGTDIYQSTDGGLNWSLKGTTNISLANLYKTASGVLYAYSNFGIAYSSNNGSSWSTISTSLNVYDITENPNGKIFLGCLTGLYESTSSSNFIKSTVGPQCVNNVKATSDNVLFYNQGVYDVVFPDQCNFGPTNEVYYYSNDEAATSNTVTSFNNGNGVIGKPIGIANGYNDKKWAGSPDYGMLYSENNESWTQVISGTTNQFRNFNYLFQTQRGLLYAISEDAVFKMRYSSKQQPYFYQVNSQIIGVKEMNLLNNGDLVIVAQSDVSPSNSKIYTSSNNGGAWTGHDEFQNLMKVAQFENGRLVAIINNNYLYTSDDDMQNWDIYGLNSSSQLVDIDIQNEFAVVTGAGSVYRSLDTGSTWIETQLFFPSGVSMTSTIITDQGTVLAGSQYNVSGGYFYRSTDSAQTFDQIGDPINGGPGVRSIVQSSTGRIYSATDDGLYYSDDDGLSWTKDLTCPLNSVKTVYVRNNEDIEISGTIEANYEYVFRKSSSDNDFWKLHMIPYPGTPGSTNYFFEDASTGYLYASDIWRTTNNQPIYLNIGDFEEINTAKIDLFDIYPNPGIISYIKLKSNPGNYQLIIYDSKGRVVYLDNNLALAKDQSVQLPELKDKGTFFIHLIQDQVSQIKQWIKK